MHYLAAVADVEPDRRAAQRMVDQVRAGIDSLRRHVGQARKRTIG